MSEPLFVDASAPTPLRQAFVHAAAWWDADVGPPRSDLLSRDDRLAASFTTRILAHVLDRVAEHAAVPLHTVPWVLGTTDDAPRPLPPGPELQRAVTPAHGVTFVHAGPATVAMTLIEALGCLVEHHAVLAAFVQDATSPHHEAIASALLISRSPGSERPLVLEPPVLRRPSLASPRPTASLHPFEAARALARAVHVRQPTVETVPSTELDRPDYWRIELRSAI